MNEINDAFKMSISLVLPENNRSGYYNAFPDIIDLVNKKIEGVNYKVTLGAGYGLQETFNVYKDDKNQWVVYPLEGDPKIHDEIRKEIDKIEKSN